MSFTKELLKILENVVFPKGENIIIEYRYTRLLILNQIFYNTMYFPTYM